MTGLPSALSLSNSVTEVGAIAAFAALLGIAILSLLVFSQAREIKRLREWAGRAPERAAEMEQRVSADAAARVQRTGAPPAPQGRVVPRKTPLVSAPVSTAVNATVAAAGLKGQPTPTPAPASPVPVAGALPPVPVEGRSATAPTAATTPAAGHDQGVGESRVKVGPLAGADRVLAGQELPSAEPAMPVADTVDGERAAPANSASAVGTAKSEDAADPEQQSAAGQPVPPMSAPAPATVAARSAGAATARAPLPPSPTSPAPPGAPSSVLPGPSTAAAQSPRPPGRPPAPAAAAARGVSSRAVAGTAATASAPSRVAPAGRARSAGAEADLGVRAGSARGRVSPSPGAGGPKYFKSERSSARAIALIVGAVIIGVLVLVFAVGVLKGGGSSKHSTSTATQSSAAGETQHAATHTRTSATAAASNPSEVAVVVLNGTGTSGLAHHLAADLQQGGYSQAAALGGVPPGTHASTVVQYARGHRADAQAVAKALNVTQVQAIEANIASLAGSATVVVLAGADQASQLGGGGVHSNGEPAAGSG
jgi:LytR cell envelope-related transcriptional attenuator